MNDKKIKMVALDLDGTTLNQYNEISPRTAAAFQKAMEKGVHIVISTGRTFRSLPEQLFHIDGLEYVVTSNGAHITALATGQVIYEDHLPPAAVEKIVSLLRGQNISVETFVGGRAFIDKAEFDEVSACGSTYRDAEYIKTTRNPVPGILDFMLEHKERIENISLNFEFIEEKNKWEPVLRKVEDTTLTSSFVHNFEIGGRGTSKAAALRHLMKRVGIESDNLMAVGDSPNDEEMIKLAGVGVAVANAHEHTKSIADYITDTNSNDGVAKAIEKFVLK